MPAVTATVGTIIVTAAAITTIARGVADTIKDIQSIRNNLNDVRDNEMQRVWQSVSNVDSDVFRTRMIELEQDVNSMLSVLDEYVALLNTTAQQWERTQERSLQNASNLRSPTRR